MQLFCLRVCTSSFVNSNLNSTLYLQFTHYSGCWFRYMRVKNNVFFLHQYMQECVYSMSQLKTAWPNAFFGGFTQHLLAQSNGEKISGVLKFFQYAPSGGWVYLARMFQFGDILGHFFFLTFWAFRELPFLTNISVCQHINLCGGHISHNYLYSIFLDSIEKSSSFVI